LFGCCGAKIDKCIVVSYYEINMLLICFKVTWDGLNKKKLTLLPPFATSIAALAFNHDGTELAIASSYTYEDGEREHPRDEILVRPMLDSECQPKSVK
jgi:hypothetical protein